MLPEVVREDVNTFQMSATVIAPVPTVASTATPKRTLLAAGTLIVPVSDPAPYTTPNLTLDTAGRSDPTSGEFIRIAGAEAAGGNAPPVELSLNS